MDICLVRGEGTRVWDSEGKEYIDCVAGIAVNNIGHCHPRVAKAIADQALRLMHCSNLYYIEPQARLAEKLVRMLPDGLDKVFFCNSGTEAIEAALKLIRRASGKPGILAAEGSFHGRTMGSLSVTGQEKYRHPFEPLVPGVKFIPFGDIQAVEEAAGRDTAGIILEPVQGEGGIIRAPPNYLRDVRQFCLDEGLVLAFDEVQTGMGRTGRFLASQRLGVTPDIVSMAKGLGGGFPIGAMAASTEMMGNFHPGDHASTFGGNPLACAAANAALDVLVEEKLAERAADLGGRALLRMKEIQDKHRDKILDARGLGLMLGLEMSSEEIAKDTFQACLASGILVNRTAGKVIRLVPPLCIEERDLFRALDAIEHALQDP